MKTSPPCNRWVRIWDADTLEHLCDMTAQPGKEYDPRVGGSGRIFSQEIDPPVMSVPTKAAAPSLEEESLPTGCLTVLVFIFLFCLPYQVSSAIRRHISTP